MSWKSVGGINYKQKNQYVRATNLQIDSVVPTQTIGKKDTTAYVEGDLFFQDGVKLYSTRNEIDSNGLYAHYPFNSIVSSGDYIFYNESKNINIDISDSHLKETKTMSIGGQTGTVAENSPKIYVDLSYGNTLHLEPKSSILYTDASFNPSKQITNDVLGDEFKAMTMNCWIYVKEPTGSTPNTGFLLFGLDTENLENTFTSAVGRERIDGQVDHLDPSFYFFCPGYGHNKPQIYWTEDVSNSMLTGDSRASANSTTPLVYNSWNMITLIVRNREVELYRNGELTDTFQVSGRMPNNKFKMIINGNRFYDILGLDDPNNNSEPSWVQTDYTSEHDVKIIDYKIFNYACHPAYIKLLYKHYSDLTGIRADSNRSQIHSKTSFNYYIDPSFSLLNSTLFIQGDILSIGKHEVFNKQTVYGPSEVLNDSYIAGSLGVGINNPDEKLHVRGNIKSSGNLYLGFEDISVNGIYFKGYTGDVNPFYKHTAIEEKYYIDSADGDMIYPYANQPSNTELLIFKGNEIHENKKDPKTISVEGSITDASWNNTQGDRIRIKAPNILFDTYNISNTNINDDTTRYEETHGMIFDQSGNLGINTLYAKQRLDVRGKINLQTDDRYDISSNIYISNTADPDPLNRGYQNTGVGGNIFTKQGFDSSANTAIGYESQRDLETGYENTTLGHTALTQNKDGYKNVAIGYKSLHKNNSNYNTSVGHGSQENTTSGLNTSLGYNTLNANTSGGENIAIGYNSMKDSTTGRENIGIGVSVLTNNDASANIAIGYYSQQSATSTRNNTTIGYKSLQQATSNDNTAVGYYSMKSKINGFNNVAVGSNSLEKNDHGYDNVAIGYKSMMDTSSNMSVAIGSHSLENTLNTQQIAIGYESQQSATDASGNVAIGAGTLKNNTVGNHNVAIGFGAQTAFQGETNSHNTTVGYKTLHKNTDGKFNTAIGHESLINNVSSHNNTSVGHDSLHENIGELNNAFGSKSLYNNYNGNNNLALGSYALYDDVSGSENIAIGNNSSYRNKENNNLSIGNNSLYNNSTGSQNISLGNYSVYGLSEKNQNNVIAIGFSSQINTGDVSSNISVGNFTLQRIQNNQNDNIAIGYESMKNKRYGNKNTSIGNYSNLGSANNGGDSNISIGYETMFDSSCDMNIAIGNKALKISSGENNIAIGEDSMISTVSGNKNIAIGYTSLNENIDGSGNTAIGYQSQLKNKNSNNLSMGYMSLHDNINGNLNTAVGYKSMMNSDGDFLISNTAVGSETLMSLKADSVSDGKFNTAIGYKSMMNALGGNDNTAVGHQSLLNNITGSKNTSIGNYSLKSNTTGQDNMSLGYESLLKNISGDYNTSVGNYSLHENISGSKNTAVGSDCMYNVTTGDNNVAVGYKSQELSNSTFNTSIGDFSLAQIGNSEDSSYNVAVGFNSLNSLTSGGTNIAMGYNTLSSAVNSEFNIGIGYSALKTVAVANSNAGSANIAIGTKAMYDVSGGTSNVGIGTDAMYNRVDGSSNFGIGTKAMYEQSGGTSNFGIGTEALHSGNGGTENFGIGTKAMYDLSGGTSNFGIGKEALHSAKEGTENFGIGTKAMYEQSGGTSNFGIGKKALHSAKEGTENFGIGTKAMHDLSGGTSNFGIGKEALYRGNGGTENFGIGTQSMYNLSGGTSNFAIGTKTMHNAEGGVSNIAFGDESMYNLKNGDWNVALGYKSLYGDVTNGFSGTNNVSIGYETMISAKDGSGNIAIGYQSLKSNLSGNYNIGFGYHSQYDNVTGNNNIAMGSQSLYKNQDSEFNIAIGNNSLYNNKEDKNIAIGYYSQYEGDDATMNTSLGNESLKENTHGIGNTAVGWLSQQKTNDTNNASGMASYNSSFGYLSLSENTTGKDNVAVGSHALQYNYNNDYNVALGNEALQMKENSTTTEANGNTAIGYQSMKYHYNNDSVNASEGNTAIGYKSLYSEHSGILQDNVAIGSQSMLDVSDNSYRNISIGNMTLTSGKVLDNIAIGDKALNRTGPSAEIIGNIAIGTNSLSKDISGNYNVAVGYQTLKENLHGDNNIALGKGSLIDSTKSNYNIGIGENALSSINNSEVSDYNISIGKDTLKNHTTGEENIVIGNETSHLHTKGSQNVYIGSKSAYSDTDGSQNTVVGYNSLNTNISGQGNSTLGYKSGDMCKGDYNIMIGYEADAPGDNFDEGDSNFIDYSISIGYKASVKNNENIAIGKNAKIDYKTPRADVSNSIAIGNNSSVKTARSTAIGVDASSNNLPNTIVIGETIPYKWLKHDHEQRTASDKYYNDSETRTFDDTVKVCIGTQSYKDTFGSDYKFRVDGSANITGNLKVDGNLIFTGDTIETIDHQVIRMSEQVDISNTGFAPALKVTQYGTDINANNSNYELGSIVEVYDGDNEETGPTTIPVFHVKNGGNTFFRNNVDISRNMIIYNETPGTNRDPNESDPSYNHFTIGTRPGNYVNHNATMRNTRDFQDTEVVNGDIQEQYPIRPITYLPPTGVTADKRYDFAGSRSGNSVTSDTKGQYSFEVSGNVFIHDYMKIETKRPFENSLDVHTTDGIQLPCGTTGERPGNYYYHANNPDPNINESVYPKVNPASDASTQRFQVNNFTGNSSDGSIRYNTDTNQCEVYAGGNMWTGLGGYKTEQPSYLFKYDLGQSQTTPTGDVPIKHNGINLSIEKTAFYGKTAWRQLDTIYYDSFTGLPYPLYHYTVVDISTNSGWQLFKVLNGNVDENGNETTPDITYNFDGRLATNQFTTKALADLPPYPDKPTIEASDTSTIMTNDSYIDENGNTSSINSSFNQNGYFNIDPDLSFNVRVYALNKSRKKTNMIYLNNIFLLRVAYPAQVNFAFANTGLLIDSQTYYPFQEYLQNGVKMNLSFERVNINNLGSTNDNNYISDPNNASLKIFDPTSTSYPSITYYNVRMYATNTKCMFNLSQSLGDGYRNTSTTSMGTNMQDGSIVDSYGSVASPNTYQIVNEFGDLEQKNVQFQHTLLPGTKYTIALTAKNNRNPYFSHAEQATWDPTTVGVDNLTTPFQPSTVTTGGEFLGFTAMPYYTNVDGYLPPSGSEDPLYVKYISKDNLIPIDLSNITFGGHRTVAVFDPTDAANNYNKSIPYYNENSNGSWGTGKYFDISGEENFYVNFNRQGTNCLGINELVKATLNIRKTVSVEMGIIMHSFDILRYSNSSNTDFITHNAGTSIQDDILSFDTTLTEAASADINKGFVQTANFKIIPSNSNAVGTAGDAVPARQIYTMDYEIQAPVSRDETNQFGYLDASSILQRTSVSPYDFYVDSYDETQISISSVTATITVDTANNLLYCMGIPSSKLVNLSVDYSLNNYADQFLPAVETINDSGAIKTLISQVSINSLGNEAQFGSQNSYDTDDIKNFIGIDDNYTTTYGDSTVTTSWPNIYLKGNYYDSNNLTDLSYQVIAYHLTNNEGAEYDNVNLISNHKKYFDTQNFTPQVPIWTDRNSFVKDSNGVISTLNPEVLNTYRPNSGSITADNWDNSNMHITPEGNMVDGTTTRTGLELIDPTANNFYLHNRQLAYFDGKFGTPRYYKTSDSVNSSTVPITDNFILYLSPYMRSQSWMPNNLNGQGAHHVNNTHEARDILIMDNTTYQLKYVIFKIPASQHIPDTGLVDISNLLINGSKLDSYISVDGSWPASLNGVFIWIAQEYNDGLNANTYYGSVNKLYDPFKTNWYLNSTNQDDIETAYGSDSAARTIDNPHHIRINTDNTDEMYLIVGLDIGENVYVNFPI